MQPDAPFILGGSSSRRLAADICGHLGLPQAAGQVLRFSEGNLFVRVLDEVRGRDAFIVQSVAFPSNDALVELLFWIDALRRGSAESVTVVMPYFSYGKGDKKDEPGVSIRARVCADAIESAGADRVVTLDLHAPQIQGFFRVPVDEMTAIPVLGSAIRDLDLTDPVVVAPDAGFAKRARRYAALLGAPLAIAYKERRAHDESAEIVEVVGSVQGRTAVIVDDFTITAGTIAKAAERLMAMGTTAVYAAVTHAVFGAGALKRIAESPIRRLLVTDSVETVPLESAGRITVVSVAQLLAEGIRRIHARQSLSGLHEGR